MYLLAKEVGTFDHPFLNALCPVPYPHELCCAGVWHSTEEKINVLKALGFHDFDFYQTLLKNPMYTNEDVEDVVPGYQSGGYVASSPINEKRRPALKLSWLHSMPGRKKSGPGIFATRL